MAGAEAQFSIYKINLEAVESSFSIKSEKNSDAYYDEIINAIINSIASIVKKKPYSSKQRFKYKSFHGIVFKTVHTPSWDEVVDHFLCKNELKDEGTPNNFLQNTNVSYVFLIRDQNNIYACTGGYGSNYINKFIVKNFGLYLLPKLIGRDNQVIKSVAQNVLVGNQASTNKVNRNSTSVSVEQDMSGIFRQINVEADRNIAEDIGVTFDEEESDKKKVNIVNKDSLVIRRSMSLSELMVVLETISEIEKKEDSFALNYMVLARKKGLKKADLAEKMISDFCEKDISRFVLVGDDYEEYYSNATRYTLVNSTDGTELLSQDEPITLDKILNLLGNDKGKISRGAMKVALKNWQISTSDNSGVTILYPIYLIDALQGFVEYGDDKIPCYLFNGNWFVFDSHYDALLSHEFEELYDKNENQIMPIMNSWGLKYAASSEEEYNQWLAHQGEVVVSHKATMGYIEIADAIFWDDNTIYFLHNKDRFDGIGARDLTNQILAAAEYFQMHRFAYDAKEFLESYYSKIEDAAKTYGRILKVSKDDFVAQLSSTKRIVYVAGYLEGYKRNSQSTYAKYLSIELQKKLIAKGYGYHIISLS